MSNKREATFHAPPLGPPGVLGPPPSTPPWAELAVQHGWNTARHEDRGDGRPWTSVSGGELPKDPRPGSDQTPPGVWVADQARADRRVVLTVALVLLTILVGTLGFIVQRMNILPVGVPLIGKDTGVAACQAMADGNGPVAAGSNQWTSGEYKQAHEIFADSRYPAIRDNGIRLVDVAWQIQALGDDPGIGVLVYVQSFTEAYSGLTGGCAEVGYTLPAMTTA